MKLWLFFCTLNCSPIEHLCISVLDPSPKSGKWFHLFIQQLDEKQKHVHFINSEASLNSEEVKLEMGWSGGDLDTERDINVTEFREMPQDGKWGRGIGS